MTSAFHQEVGSLNSGLATCDFSEFSTFVETKYQVTRKGKVKHPKSARLRFRHNVPKEI